MMSARGILPLVESFSQGFHLERIQTLATLCAGLISAGRVGIAAIGRAIDWTRRDGPGCRGPGAPGSRHPRSDDRVREEHTAPALLSDCKLD